MIFIESNIIYNFDDLRILLNEKTKKGSYFLLGDDIYFEEMEKDTVISRDVLVESRKKLKQFSVIKYISFKTNKDCTTKAIYNLIQTLKENTTIIVTIFNPIDMECSLIFIGNKNDSILENYIRNFIELGGY